MTKSQCYAEINRCRSLIADFEAKIKVLEGEITELEASKDKVGGIRSDFSDCKSVSSSRLNNVGLIQKLNPRIGERFYSGMSGMLNGLLYITVYSGLGTAIQTIEHEINNKKSEITKLRNKINDCNNKISQMKRRIAQIEAQERAEAARRAAEAAAEAERQRQAAMNM